MLLYSGMNNMGTHIQDVRATHDAQVADTASLSSRERKRLARVAHAVARRYDAQRAHAPRNAPHKREWYDGRKQRRGTLCTIESA